MAHNNPNLVDPVGIASNSFPLHPAEERLRSQLPEILNIARKQVSGALEILTPQGEEATSLSNRYLRIIKDFIGDTSTQSIVNLRNRFELIKRVLARLTPENFNIVYSFGQKVVWVEGRQQLKERTASAWVAAHDKARFQKGHPPIINMSYINLASQHPAAIADVVIHEVSHLALSTKDPRYATFTHFLMRQKSFYRTTLLSPLYEYAKQAGSNPLENADTLSNLVAVLYHVSRKSRANDIYPQVLGSAPRFGHYLGYGQLPSGSASNMSELELASARSGLRFDTEQNPRYSPSADPAEHFNPELFDKPSARKKKTRWTPLS